MKTPIATIITLVLAVCVNAQNIGKKDSVLLGSERAIVESLLPEWASRRSNRSEIDKEIVYYSKDVEIIVTYQGNIAKQVDVIDRPGSGVSPISEIRFKELVKLIGAEPQPDNIKRQNGIREFFVSVSDKNNGAKSPQSEAMPSTAKQSTGRLHAQVTIEGKNKLGSNAVTGILIPSTTNQFKTKISLPTDIEFAKLIEKDPEKAGCFVAEADADGRLVFNNVPSGKYNLTIITTEFSETPKKLTEVVLAPYFEQDAFEKVYKHKKCDRVAVEILPNETAQTSCHFD